MSHQKIKSGEFPALIDLKMYNDLRIFNGIDIYDELP